MPRFLHVQGSPSEVVALREFDMAGILTYAQFCHVALSLFAVGKLDIVVGPRAFVLAQYLAMKLKDGSGAVSYGDRSLSLIRLHQTCFLNTSTEHRRRKFRTGTSSDPKAVKTAKQEQTYPNLNFCARKFSQ